MFTELLFFEIPFTVFMRIQREFCVMTTTMRMCIKLEVRLVNFPQ